MSGPKFAKGNRVINTFSKKVGTIKYIRTDSYEQKNNHPYGYYYYFIEYDNGSFETYESESNIEHNV
jgi:hypothetical protein